MFNTVKIIAQNANKTKHDNRIKLLVNRNFVGKNYIACEDHGSIKKGDVLNYVAHGDCPKCKDKPFNEKCMHCKSRAIAYNSWEHHNLTREEIIREHVYCGHPITTWNHQYTGWKQKRTNGTAIASNMFAKDYDHTDAETVAAHPFIQKHAVAVYSSASGYGCHALFITDFAMTSKKQYGLFYDALLYATRELQPDMNTKLGTGSGMLYGPRNPKFVWTNTNNTMSRDDIQSIVDNMQERRKSDRQFIASLALKYADDITPIKPKSSRKPRTPQLPEHEMLAKIKADDFQTFKDYRQLADYIMDNDVQIPIGYRNATSSKVAYNLLLRGKSYADVNELIQRKGISWGLSVGECNSIVSSAHKGICKLEKQPEPTKPKASGISTETKKSVVNIINHSDQTNGYPIKGAIAIADISDSYKGGCKSLIADVAGQNRKTVASYIDELSALGLVENYTEVMLVNGYHKAVTCYTASAPEDTASTIKAGGRLFEITRAFFDTVTTLSERAASVLMQLLKAGGRITKDAIATQSQRTIERALKELIDIGIVHAGKQSYRLADCLGLVVVKATPNTDLQCVQFCQSDYVIISALGQNTPKTLLKAAHDPPQITKALIQVSALSN